MHGYGNLGRLLEVVGTDRVVLGSDYPADMGQPDPVRWIRESPLPAAEQEAILGGNARTLLASCGWTTEVATS